jgi:Holliday junction resolvase RusA-like endonuclease
MRLIPVRRDCLEIAYKIIVDGVPPSNNKYLGNSKDFNVYRREKQLWEWKVKVAIGTKPPEPLTNAIVHIRYFFKDKRRRDPDNYSGKMLLDPLVMHGILADDSFNNVQLVLSAEVDKNRPRTEITVIPQEAHNG